MKVEIFENILPLGSSLMLRSILTSKSLSDSKQLTACIPLARWDTLDGGLGGGCLQLVMS